MATLFMGCTKQGATGPAGANGNANVISSVYDVQPSSWSSDGSGGWYCSLTPVENPTLGAVEIYASTDGTDWAALPAIGYTVGAPDINYACNTTTLQVSYDAQTGTASIAKPVNLVYIKVILIPPAVMKQHPNTNWKDINEVNSIMALQK